MKKYLPLFLSTLAVLNVPGQQQKYLRDNLQLSLGKSFHGSGDLNGIFFSSEYGHYFKRRLEISGNVSSTIHHGAFTLLISAPYGNYDASFRYVTAGLQAGGKIGFAILRSRQHELKMQTGALFRYQSSSSDGYGITFPPVINYPEPVFTFRNYEKQNLFTAGYTADLSYTFTTGKNLLLGIKAGFQNDTNGDVISHISFIAGKRLKGKK